MTYLYLGRFHTETHLYTTNHVSETNFDKTKIKTW